jgi:hypothetical protein
MKSKGQFTIQIVIYLAIALIVLYLCLFLPFPAFTRLRMQINYFIFLLIWIILQIGIILAYVKLGQFFTRNFKKIKMGIVNFTLKIQKYIHSHS